MPLSLDVPRIKIRSQPIYNVRLPFVQETLMSDGAQTKQFVQIRSQAVDMSPADAKCVHILRTNAVTDLLNQICGKLRIWLTDIITAAAP